MTIINLDGNQQQLTVDCTLVYTNPVSYEMKNGDIGYVKIASFDSGSRGAGGQSDRESAGAGQSALCLTSARIPADCTRRWWMCWTIFAQRRHTRFGQSGGEETVERSDNVCLSMPMVVLVNSDTYAAAEFFAAALQDYRWAGVVGERTTGKGRIQMTIELTDGSAIHISQASISRRTAWT